MPGRETIMKVPSSCRKWARARNDHRGWQIRDHLRGGVDFSSFSFCSSFTFSASAFFICYHLFGRCALNEGLFVDCFNFGPILWCFFEIFWVGRFSVS